MGGLFKNATRAISNSNRGGGLGYDVEAPIIRDMTVKLSDPFISRHFTEVMEEINSQPEDLAYILHLALLQQFTSKEIEQIVDVKSGTIAMMVSRFRTDLRKKFL